MISCLTLGHRPSRLGEQVGSKRTSFLTDGDIAFLITGRDSALGSDVSQIAAAYARTSDVAPQGYADAPGSGFDSRPRAKSERNTLPLDVRSPSKLKARLRASIFPNLRAKGLPRATGYTRMASEQRFTLA